jgi:hypothetical protein
VHPQLTVAWTGTARFWSAPAKRSGDGAFLSNPHDLGQIVERRLGRRQSGVALRLPPHSKESLRDAPNWSGSNSHFDSERAQPGRSAQRNPNAAGDSAPFSLPGPLQPGRPRSAHAKMRIAGGVETPLDSFVSLRYRARFEFSIDLGQGNHLPHRSLTTDY